MTALVWEYYVKNIFNFNPFKEKVRGSGHGSTPKMCGKVSLLVYCTDS